MVPSFVSRALAAPPGTGVSKAVVSTKHRIESGAIGFWRSCGFRRIGASRYFTFSFDLQYQSRTLPVSSDFDPLRIHAEDLEDEELEDI